MDIKYDCKTNILGPSDHHDKELRILNRVIAWDEVGLRYEADQRHADLLIKDLGLTEAKPVSTPGTKEIKIECNNNTNKRNKINNSSEGVNNESDDLDPNEKTRYRALAAR